MNKKDRYLKLASLCLSLSALGLLAASVALVSDSLAVNTRFGRHLIAGALANTALAVVEFLIARYPIRRGERWAFWAFLIPTAVYGLPVLVIDATFVQRAHLFATLAPQIAGLCVAILGLRFAYVGIFKSE